MASAKTGVHVMQLKKVQVPSKLQQGDKFYRIEDLETGNLNNQVTLKVDSRGFFIQIVSENANVENELIDIALVRDTRTGKQARLPRDNKAKEASNLGSPKIQLDRTFTIVWGSEFANVNFINFSCDNKETAQVSFFLIFKRFQLNFKFRFVLLVSLLIKFIFLFDRKLQFL